MSRIVLSVLLGSAALVAALPISALAQSSVPPGDSEVDQYVPTIPDSEGDKTPGGAQGGGPGGGAGGGDAGTALPSSTAESLRAAGPDGESALSLAEETAPADSVGGQAAGRDGATGRDGAKDSAGAGRSVASADESVAGTVVEGLSSGQSGGMGILLPILLGVVAGAGAFMLLRRRLPTYG